METTKRLYSNGRMGVCRTNHGTRQVDLQNVNIYVCVQSWHQSEGTILSLTILCWSSELVVTCS